MIPCSYGKLVRLLGCRLLFPPRRLLPLRKEELEEFIEDWDSLRLKVLDMFGISWLVDVAKQNRKLSSVLFCFVLFGSFRIHSGQDSVVKNRMTVWLLKECCLKLTALQSTTMFCEGTVLTDSCSAGRSKR